MITMTIDELLEELQSKIDDLGWDYDRMSQAGKQTYDEICFIIAKIME